MECNETTTMSLDVKLDIHEKRPQIKTWTRCEVKIEAIKCLPCFLRITFVRRQDEEVPREDPKSLCISINVPGVTISLAASRTKQHSYGLFWTQNRRPCFIYFALDTEASCRRHMKWIKKSIKNLELHRQVFLEQRRNSRGPWRFGAAQGVAAGETSVTETGKAREARELNLIKATLGPLPQIPDFSDSNSSCAWSGRVSRASDIYEEIFEGTRTDQHEPPRLSRRFSRTSIASGIYEEMKPTAGGNGSSNNFNAIVEELTSSELTTAAAAMPPQPPPLPPLPPPRKRINTFETEKLSGLLGEIPRSNTNPESELAKKKKYRNVLENIFGSGRTKRAGSVSEPHVYATSVEDLIDSNRHREMPPIYANEALPLPTAASKQANKLLPVSSIVKSKRNSFSSPDLSKINFLDTFDEDKIADILLNSFLNHDDSLDLSNESLDDSAILPLQNAEALLAQVHAHRRLKADSLEILNFSQQLPSNFNFSAAANCSTINLLGANGAVPLPTINSAQKKNKILVDDLTGYCVMAPIIKKTSTESGYSTGSYCSSTSSCNTNSQEDPPVHPSTATTDAEVELRKPPPPSVAEESVIYENMHGSNNTSRSTIAAALCSTPPSIAANGSSDFTGNLYENLLAVKAAQELGDKTAPPSSSTLSTSTPTDSPHTLAITSSPAIALTAGETEEEESYYQTPRKSIISVDDKIPSYYPNSCDTVKVRRQSPAVAAAAQQVTPTNSLNEKSSSTSSLGLRHLVTMKMRRERKENLYISSPQKIIEQRQNSSATASATAQKLTKSTHKSKKTAAAHKISENVYAVTHASKKSNANSNNNNQSGAGFSDEMKEKLQTELLQLAMLQNIDFKFDDAKTHEIILPSKKNTEAASPSHHHHLQLNQAANTKAQAMTTAAAAATMTQSTVSGDGDLQLSGMRKFASLPRFKKIDFSPLKLKINNVLQRNQHQEF